VIRIMNFIEFNNFVFLNKFLLTDMITKIDTRKLEHQSNIGYLFEIAITSSKANQNKLWRLVQNQPNVERWKWKKKSKKDSIKKRKMEFIKKKQPKKDPTHRVNLEISWFNSLPNMCWKLTSMKVTLTWYNKLGGFKGNINDR
jgi:hypothetical protein